MRPRPILQFARGPCRKASDEVPTLRLARGPTRKASDEVPILCLARGRLDISPAIALTELPDEASHPTEALNHSHNVSRTTAQYSGVTDETEVALAPCHPGQDGAGVTGHYARHCAHD